MDLMVGGAILISLFILVAGVLWLKEVSITRRMASYTALFPNVGALQIGDPVKINGVKLGSVGDIKLHGTRVKVVMRIDRSVTLTDKAVATVQNIGLMGERNIMVQLSDQGQVYPPDNRRDKSAPVLEGYFDSGIAEAMGMVGTVLSEVRVVVRNVESVLNSTVADSTFLVFFRTVVGRLDTVSAIVENLATANAGRLDESVANVHAITGDIRRLLDQNRDNFNALVANGTQLSQQAVRIASDVESLTVSMGEMVSAIERGEGTLGMLVEDDDFSRDLKETLGKVDTLASEVQEKGLKLRIRLGFRDRRKSD